MLVRIEFFADGIDLADVKFFEYRSELLERQLDTVAIAFQCRIVDADRGFETVLDREQFAGELFQRELACLVHVFHGAASNVFALGFGIQHGCLLFGKLGLELGDAFLGRGCGFRRHGFIGLRCLVFLHKKIPLSCYTCRCN